MKKKQLQILSRQLEWQMQSIKLQLARCMDNKKSLKQELITLKESMDITPIKVTRVHPEQELSRLAFFSQQMQQHKIITEKVERTNHTILKHQEIIKTVKSQHTLIKNVLHKKTMEQKKKQRIKHDAEIEHFISGRDNQ